MIKTYFRTAFRNMLRNKYYTGIHVFGLGLGMACCLFIYVYVHFHLGYDRYHKYADRIYHIGYDLHMKETEHNGEASYAIYEALKTKVAGVKQAAFSMIHQELTIRAGEHLFRTDRKAAFASSEWFKLFNYRWVRGDARSLDEPNTVALVASTAKRYFGKEDPMGKTLYAEGRVPLKVIGVIDDEPSNTSLRSDLYISQVSIKTFFPDPETEQYFFTNWGYLSSSNQVYVSVTDAMQAKKIEQSLQELTDTYFGKEVGKLYHFRLLPLQEAHFDTLYGGTMQKSLLVILGIIGLSILLIATLNYINLSLVQYAKRGPGIATRKLLGSSRWQLFRQFMTESFCITGLATLFAMGLLLFVFPLANRYLFIDEPVALPSWRLLGALAFILWGAVSILSGIYPAVVIGRMAIVKALKNKVSLGSSAGREAVVVVQSVISQTLIIATVVMLVQIHFLRSTDIGFNRDSILMVSLPKKATKDPAHIRALLEGDPNILHYSFCFRAPASHDNRGSTFLFDNRADWESWPARSTYADSAYLHTMGIRLLAGKNLAGIKTAVPEYLINEKMARLLGFSDLSAIVGKSLLYGGMSDKPGVIAGVVADYNTKSLRDGIAPTVMGFDPEMSQSLAVKLNGAQAASILSKLEKEWQLSYPDELFTYQFLDDQIGQLYAKERIQQKLIWTASAVAILICSLGLLGLISLSVLQRTKEIGIRKVLGASVTGIVRMLSSGFVKLVLVALLIASPIAWWAMERWLEDFAYRIAIQWWMFAVAGLGAVLIALLTVGFQAVKAALANPVDSLRDE